MLEYNFFPSIGARILYTRHPHVRTFPYGTLWADLLVGSFQNHASQTLRLSVDKSNFNMWLKRHLIEAEQPELIVHRQVWA